MMAKKVLRCSRCRRRCRSLHNAADWNVTLESGIPVELTCPDCQTAAEHAEAEIHSATLDYVGMDASGRLYGVPKASAPR